MTFDARAGGCWCETLPGGGGVLHMTVVFVAPGKMLRLRGALGPFQSTGMDGAMTITLDPAKDGGTALELSYNLGGYVWGGYGALRAKPTACSTSRSAASRPMSKPAHPIPSNSAPIERSSEMGGIPSYPTHADIRASRRTGLLPRSCRPGASSRRVCLYERQATMRIYRHRRNR